MRDEEATQKPVQVDDYGLEPDFDVLEEEDREVSTIIALAVFWTTALTRVAQNEDEEVGREFEAQISKMRNDLERLAPNMKAVERLDEVERELDDAEREAEETRKESKRAKDDFQAIKKKR